MLAGGGKCSAEGGEDDATVAVDESTVSQDGNAAILEPKRAQIRARKYRWLKL